MRLFFTLLTVLGLALPGGICRAQVVQYLAEPQGLTALPPAPAYIARVVDARPYRTALGYTKAGSPVAQPLMFRDELAATMQRCFTHFAPGQPQAVPLVLRLTRLEAAEDTRYLSAAKVTATMEAILYAPQADGTYRAVANFAQQLQHPVSGGAGAALVSHTINLTALFLNAAAVGANQAAWLAFGPAYSAAQLATVVEPTATLPRLQPGAPRKPGFYYSWAEFRADDPGEPGAPEVEARPIAGSQWAGDEDIKPYHIRNGKRVLATDVWGFSDGDQVYIRQGRDFYRLRPHQDDYIFFGRAGTDAATHSAINMLGVASALTTGVGGLSTNAEHRALYRLSTVTGTVSESESMGTALASGGERPTQLFIYRPRQAKGAAVRVRLSSGGSAQELAANDYVSFSPPLGPPITVYLTPATGPEIALPVALTTSAAVYLEYSPADPLPLHQVKEAVGAAAVTRLIK
ncbi:MAG: hypothetical protein ACRYF0_11090 [Janthinobacterium lividum]